MDQNKFIQLCKYRAMHYINEKLDIGNAPNKYEVYVVWSCYSKETLSHKALIASTVNDDYFEFIYNGVNHRFYMNAYKKSDRQLIAFKPDEDIV